MFFYASKVLWLLGQPGNLFCLLLILATVLAFTRRTGALRFLLVVLSLTAVATAVFAAGDHVVAAIEERFPPPRTMPEKVDGIIVLGGMVNAKLSAERGKPMITAAVERLLVDEVDMTRRRRAEVVDKMAAAYILQGALDAMARG